MDNKALMIRVASALTTLAEETSGCSESILYIALCDSDLASWEALRDILVKAKYVTIKGNWVMLTPLGKDTANLINDIIRTYPPVQ